MTTKQIKALAKKIASANEAAWDAREAGIEEILQTLGMPTDDGTKELLDECLNSEEPTYDDTISPDVQFAIISKSIRDFKALYRIDVLRREIKEREAELKRLQQKGQQQ